MEIKKLKGNDPAFPCQSPIHGKMFEGLTKREYFVGQVLAGLSDIDDHPENIARDAIKIADEVMKQLNINGDE